MIPDSVKQYLTDPDHILAVVLLLFFVPEMVMLYELPYTSYWIPLISVISRFALPSIIPDSIDTDNKFFHFSFLMIITSIGYGILYFVAIDSLRIGIISFILITIILISQFSGWAPNVYNKATVNIQHKIILWRGCIEIEAEKKDD